jgi:hypothetical protein
MQVKITRKITSKRSDDLIKFHLLLFAQLIGQLQVQVEQMRTSILVFLQQYQNVYLRKKKIKPHQYYFMHDSYGNISNLDLSMHTRSLIKCDTSFPAKKCDTSLRVIPLLDI